MGNIKEPKYDTDQVNYGFLKKILSFSKEQTEKEIKTYSKSFSSPPNPPYYVGWTYSQDNKVYRCIKDRLIGSFSIADWVVIYNEKQNNLIAENFLFLSEVDVKEQSDGKIETFYQDNDPSSDWDTSILKAEHEGDYWRTLKDGIYHSYVYTKIATNPITYDWLEINVPIAIFDTISGHKNIFTSIPNNYIKNDFIRVMTDEVASNFNIDIEIGDFLYSTVTNTTFNPLDWHKKEDELSLKSLESYYYTTDEINKIVEVINSNIESDIVKSSDSIKAFVKQTYTEKTTTENLTKKVDANGKIIEEIKGINTTEVPTLNLAELSILLDQISQTVTKSLTLTNTLTNLDNIELTEAMEGNILELRIKGQMSLFFPSKEIYPSSNLYGKTSYLIIEYEDGTQEKIRLPVKRLRKLGEVSDEFIINSTETKLIKRIGVDENNEEYLLSEEKVIKYDNIIVPLKNGKNVIYLSSFKNSGLNFSATYAIKNEFTETFATKIQMAASILASANGILLETKQEIENATAVDILVSRINMSPEEIKLLAKKIVFEGLVTANENFKILEDGTVEAKNGKFSGHVEADSGKFKGNIYLEDGSIVVGGSGMLTTKMIDANIKSQQFVGGNVLLPMGFSYTGSGCVKDCLEFAFEVPEDFTILNAYIILDHIPVSYYNAGTPITTGYSRNLKLYKSSSKLSTKITVDNGYAMFGYDSAGFSEVPNAFGNSGFTGSSSNGTSKKTIDIISYIDKGFNLLKIESDASAPSNYSDCYAMSGACKATLYINGYTKFN